MPNEPNIVIDAACEFLDMLRPWIREEFWSAEKIDWKSGLIYIIDRQRFVESADVIKHAIDTVDSTFVFSLPFEGSETMINHCLQYGLRNHILSKKLLLISGGSMPQEWPSLHYDMFLTKFHDFEENVQAADQSHLIFEQLDKPYKFLFFNGRERPHRKYLVERLDDLGLLDQAIWSYLSPVPASNKHTDLIKDGVDLMQRPRAVKLLEPRYEVDRYKNNQITNLNRYVKAELFDHEWGDIYVNPLCYIDTYFSLVTETVFDLPHSFRTEKIVKPIGMAHPFVVAANRGYYRDLHDLGFRTFGNLIDESFDEIDHNPTRLDRITNVVKDLCDQDLPSFLLAAQEVCKYNQQHLLEIRPRIQKEFSDRFFQFLKQHE